MQRRKLMSTVTAEMTLKTFITIRRNFLLGTCKEPTKHVISKQNLCLISLSVY